MELAQCYLGAGQRQQAIDILSEFQKLGIKNPFVQDTLAKLTAKNP